ncbi:hypothetical protein KP509_17G001300 [Ceratopteris richardii]|nr:hypothetical protein KP509_17G001300 [Ceratopteris richardii]
MVQCLVDKWESAGAVAEWSGKFGTYDMMTKQFIEDMEVSKKRYVGVPGMNAICQTLSEHPGVAAKFNTIVAKMDWVEERKVWTLTSKDGMQLGEFWAVVATDKIMASPRAFLKTGLPRPLDVAVPYLAEKVSAVTSSPSFACMLVFSQSLTTIPLDGFNIVGSKVLAWASCDSSKPKRDKLMSSGECWVLHSTAEYALEVIKDAGMEKPSDELLSAVARCLFEEFKKIGGILEPMFAKAHRWGSAFPDVSIAKEEGCLLDEFKRIAVCGDFCVGPRVECAILSGISAAEKVQDLTYLDSKY